MIRRMVGAAVLGAVMVLFSVFVAAPTAGAADTVKCRIYGNQASQVCVDFSRATIAVNDGRVDGLTAVGYWSGAGTTGSCVDGGGGGNDEGVLCSLPARYGTTVCFRAAVRKGSDIRGQTDRSCGTITFRKSGPS